MKKLEVVKRLLCVGLTLFSALSLTACSGQTEEQNNDPSTTTNNVIEQESSAEIALDFDLPENYEETAKQFASDFTIRWASAYRSNKAEILQTLIDDYYSMIRDPNTGEPRNYIVTAWNGDHENIPNSWRTYVAGPTVSSVEVKDNYIEENAVHLTVEVSMTATVQTYSRYTWGLTGYPISVIDSGTYEMYYDSNGWHFKTANLRLNG